MSNSIKYLIVILTFQYFQSNLYQKIESEKLFLLKINTFPKKLGFSKFIIKTLLK